LTGDSRELLSSSRDRLKWDTQRELDIYLRELLVDTRSAEHRDQQGNHDDPAPHAEEAALPRQGTMRGMPPRAWHDA
jgi:hypothetical protein